MSSNIIIKPPVQGGAPPAPPEDLPSFDVDEGPMRSELRRQIAALETELTTVVARSCPWEPRTVNASRGPAVQSGANLEQIRDELLASLHDLCRRIEGGVDWSGGDGGEPAIAGPAPSPEPSSSDERSGGRGWRRLTRR